MLYSIWKEKWKEVTTPHMSGNWKFIEKDLHLSTEYKLLQLSFDCCSK